MALKNAGARLIVLKKRVRDIKNERKELEEKFIKVEKEKEEREKSSTRGNIGER